MPFKSKRQQRAAFGGHIPGISKEKAKEWAKETPSFADLPERAPAEKGQPTLLSKEAQTVNKRLLDAIDAAGVPVAAFPSGYLDHAAAAYIPKFLGPIQEHIRDQVLTQPNIAPNTAESLKKFLQMHPGGVHFYGGRAAALHERPGVIAHEFGHALAEKEFPNVTKAESAARLLFGGNHTAPVAGFIVGASTGEGSSKTRETAAPLLTAAATGLPLASAEGQAWYHGLGPLRQAGGDVADYHDMNARNLISQAAPVALRGAVGYAAGRGARRAFDHLRRRKAEAAVEEEAAKQSQLAHGADSGDGLPPKAIRKGQKVEREHTKNPATARQIAIDHLRERPDYYTRLAKAEKQAALSSKEISKNLFDTIEAAGVPLKHVSPEALPEGVLAAYMPKYVQGSLSPADLKEVSDAGFTFGGIHLPKTEGSNRWGIPISGAEAQGHFNPSILAHEFGHAVAERKYPRVARAEQAANDFVTGGAGSLLSLGAGLATGRNSSTAREVLTPLGIMAAAALPLAVTEGQAWYHGLAPLRQAGGNALHYHAKNLSNLAGQAAVPAVATGISYGLGRGARYIYDRVRHGPKEKEAALSPTAIRALQHGGIGAGAGALVGAGAGAAGADPNQRGRGALRGALTGAGIGFAGGAGGSLLHSRIKPPPLATSRAAMGTSPTIMAHAPAQSLTFPDRTSAFQVTNPTEYRHFEGKGWWLGPGDMMYPPHALEARGEAMGARIESFKKKKAAAHKQSASVSELEARLNQMQAEQEHAARADRIVHGLDALGLGILAAPAAGELAVGVGKRLEGRGGLIGGVGGLLHHGGEAVHHHLGEGTGKAIGEVVGLGLMVPHLVHPIAHRLTQSKIAPAPSTLAPSVPEQPQAASDMRAMSSAAEKVGRLLAQPGPQEKVAINLGGVGNWAWKNKKTLAGIGAVGTVGAGIYGAKKGIDAAHHAVTHQHEALPATGVGPGMRPATPSYMPIGSS